MKSLARIVAMFLLLVGALWCQNDGTPTFGLQQSFGLDTIDLVTLTPEIRIPVYSKQAPYPFSPQIELYQDCDVTPYPYDDGASWEPAVSCGTGHVWTTGNFGYFRYYYTPYTNGTCSAYEDFTIQGADNTAHAFGLSRIWYTSSCGATSGTFTATDNSGWQLYVELTSSGLTVEAYDASGDSVTVLCGSCEGTMSLTDPYGNVVSEVISGNTVTWTDQYGVVSPTLTNSGTTSETLTWLNVDGSNTQLTETWGSSQDTSSDFGSCIYQQESGTTTPLKLLTFPDGSVIGLSWEQGPTSGTITGRLGGYTTRQGGTITYTYSNNYCVVTGSGETIRGYVYPGTLTRKDPDGTWTFSLNWNSSTNVETTTVLDPGQNKTVYTFTGFYPPATSAVSPSLTQVQVYQNTGTMSSPAYTLSKTIVYCYNANSSSCATTLYAYPITERDTYITLGSMATSSRVQELFDQYGNTTSTAQYDFGATSPTLTTTTVYGTWNGSSCVAIGSYIQDRPCDSTTTNGGNTLSETRNTYDTHGGLLTTSRWTGSAWLTTTYTRKSNGPIATMTPPFGSASSYGYAPTGSGGCNSLLLTSTTAGPLTSSQTWNCYGAVLVSATDVNSQITTYTHNDPFFRITSATDPLGYTATTTYNSPTETTITPPGGYGNIVTTTNGLNQPYLYQIQQGAGASEYDTVETKVGFIGNGTWVHQTSNAVAAALGAGAGGGYMNQTEYDPLRRPIQFNDNTHDLLLNTVYTNQDSSTSLTPAPTGENVKTTQTELNGLGQVTSVCNISSSVSSTTACGQAAGGSGILTTTAYAYGSGSISMTTTRGSETKVLTTDALGRKVTDTIPERVTYSYVYDTQTSSCGSGSYAGHLVQVNKGWSTKCLVYDQLNRLTQTIYYSSHTDYHCSYFVYGDTNPIVPSGSGISYGSYANNRVVDAYTSETCGGRSSLTTDEWFAYDADGRMTDMWELTPQSGSSYYHTTAGYNAQGTITSISGIPGMLAFSFPLDAEGRVDGLTYDGTAQLSNASFDAAHSLLKMTVGASDSEAFTYDLDERMTGWTYSVGGESETGVVTYNSNGTIEEMGITDGLNSGGTETCYYNSSLASGTGYDDVGRLIGVSCGSIWAQTFSYDQYDNITQSGSLNWGCTGGCYNTNNHYTASIGAGVAYDTDGNVQDDSIYAYSWYPDGKLEGLIASGSTISCGSAGYCAWYDAYGRMVQTSNGTAYNEFILSPMGEVAQASGQTVDIVRFPVLGGTFFYSPGAGAAYFTFSDWVGSSRVAEQISTSGSGTAVKDIAYSPYGYPYNAVITTVGMVGTSFIGTFEDIAPNSNIFDTPNRELPVGQARWLSPDPVNSSWNAYAYVTDPIVFLDPSGLDCALISGAEASDRLVDGSSVVVGPGDCPGKNPNNEIYVDCDGCLNGITFQAINGVLVAFDSSGNAVGLINSNGDFETSAVNGNVQCFGECPSETVTVNGGSAGQVPLTLQPAIQALPPGYNMPMVSQWRPPKPKDVVQAPYKPLPYKPAIKECFTNPGNAVDLMEEAHGQESGPGELHDPDFPLQLYQNTTRGIQNLNTEAGGAWANGAVVVGSGLAHFGSCMLGALFGN